MGEITLPEARKTVFVVGLGMVGIAFIEKLLNLDTQMRYRIVTCGEEMHLAYNRVALTDYFQHRNVEKLYLNQADWYAAQDPTRFQFFVGEAVTAIDTNAHTVSTDKGRVVKYDYCVLATGSEATLPSFASPHVRGVFVYRNIADLNNLLAYSQTEGVKGEPSVVVGGGLLGLEAAKALYDLEDVGAVTIVHRQAYPLSRQLDAAGGEIVLRRIEALGVRVLGQLSPSRLVTELQDGAETLTGVELSTGKVVPCRIAVFSVGIRPRDELAIAAGIQCEGNNAGGRGITVDDLLQTSAPDVFAIGECASWQGQTYGLIAPGIEMADILSFNLTQTQTDIGGFAPRKMNTPDLSTKLKLVGVDVASFGDYFADKSRPRSLPSKPFTLNNAPPASSSPEVQDPSSSQPPQPHGTTPSNGESAASEASNKGGGSERKRADASSPRKRHGQAAAAEGPIETLTYRDPFAGVYKKYIFSADGKYILGGMMVGDTNDYIKLLALVKKKKPLEVPPSQFIAGSSSGDDSGADLDDDTQICSCHNVTKGDVAQCVKDGADTLVAVKSKTKAGTGCGGCLPLVTNIFKAEMKKAGNEVSNNLCPHFAMTRAELFNVAKIKKLKTFTEIMTAVGVHKDAVGCETCKPAIGSILASLWNEHIMNPVHHANQDTNDRFLANIQRNGTFSVIPRIPAGEITPDKLLALAQVAKKYGLYTKITGGQRIDLFGAQKADLPAIWKELGDAGFESGHAYGKALRTVKSCVGTSWCRYGVGDSVGLAIALEERYKGIRAPHKFKGGVSGCVRECAEAQSKDFGLIATDKGWNIFIGGNGGANPRHATLFATDVPPSHAVKIMDRFLMYYIRTADKLMRTARWIEQMDGGVERLKKILLDDELGICEDLEKEMDELVGTYVDEWKVVVQDPERQKQFRQFANTDERVAPVEPIPERGQQRPADWPKASPAVHLRAEDIAAPKEEWAWRPLARVSDLTPTDAGTTSAAVKYGESQLAIFHVPRRGYFATQQMCPHKRAFVLEHGIVGDDPTTGALYVSCPMHKRNFSLTTGTCINDDAYSIIAFDVRVDPPSSPSITSSPSSPSAPPEDTTLSVFLPQPPALDAVLATGKWMVRRDTARTLDGPSTTTTNGVVPKSVGDGVVPKSVLASGVPYSFPVSSVDGAGGCAATECGDSKLDW